MKPRQSALIMAAPKPVPVVVDPLQILTLREIADRLKVSQRWVYEKTRNRCQNPLPCIRIGRYLRFNWQDVSAWLQGHSNVPQPSQPVTAFIARQKEAA
jgi:excisionase family DNA binding protein